MSGGFEVGASAALRALHRIPWLPPPEGELHPHDYRIEVVVERAALDERGMVCDLDLVEAALGDAVGTLEGKDLDVIRPPDAEASRWRSSPAGSTRGSRVRFARPAARLSRSASGNRLRRSAAIALPYRAPSRLRGSARRTPSR